MDVFTAISNRRSIRKYSSKPVEEEKLMKVLEAGRLSPSANNRQNWKFIVVRDEETRKKLAAACGNNTFVAEAPVTLVICGIMTDNDIMMCGQPRHTVDCSIATSFMILQAYELGLGTCWLGAFREPEVKEILNIPDNVRVVAITPLGYPDQEPVSRGRKSLNEVVCFDQYK